MQVKFYGTAIGRILKPEDAVKGSQDGFDHIASEQILEGPLESSIYVEPKSEGGNNLPINMIVAGDPRKGDSTFMIWFHDGCEPDYKTVAWAINEHIRRLW